MAQQKKKKKTTASSSRKKLNTKKDTVNKNSVKTPKRRGIGAVIFLILGIISAFGYFESGGAVLDFICGVFKGVVGWGFYFLPPALLFSAFIFIFHRGKPVRLRVFCTLMVPVIIGALYQTIAKTAPQEIVVKTLWNTGRDVVSGGLLSGTLGILFADLLTKGCAIAIFIICIILLLLGITNQTIAGIVEKVRNRPRVEYEPMPEPEPKIIKKPYEESPEYRKSLKKRPNIDIPLDEPGAESFTSTDLSEYPKKETLFNKKANVITPDQLIKGESADKKPVSDVGTDSTEETENIDSNSNADNIFDVSEIKDHEIELHPVFETAAPKPQSKKTRSLPVQPADDSAVSAEKEEIDGFKKQIEFAAEKQAENMYIFPPIDLLEAPLSGGRIEGREETEMNKNRLETTLRSFGINSSISGIIRGPAVTRYEMELEPGVKLNKITNLSDDIALSLGASGVRIAAIPNKISTVGIEVPNKLISKVFLREIIDSPEFKGASSKLSFALGKNISGEAMIGNISKLPHMLVAGTTGSGKSVCLNSLILSILYKANPDEVKFIMVDPKMVEFKIYNGIPHLLVPVVTEAKKAAGALQWAVAEMMKRYRLFSESGARDLASYNKIAAKDDELQEKPQVIVVIDELADLMLVAAKEVEESICRIAQMGRAAGIHLVIATQSPRADVITGLMKANIPSRIALKVSSSLESRIILDAGGNADKLVGNGDMLYAPMGTSKPIRIQGTWVSDDEREKIVSFIKSSGEAAYAEDVIYEIEKAAEDKNTGNKAEVKAEEKSDYDELLPQAVDVVLEFGQASVSMLQRRLKLGYSRAARIVDQMEDMGVVGPFEGSKPRQLLITKQQWQEMQFVQGTAPVEQLSIESNQTMYSVDDLFDNE